MERKSILAFVLIGLIIILMPYYFKMVSPPPEEQADSLGTLQEEMIPARETVRGGESLRQEMETTGAAGGTYQDETTGAEIPGDTSPWYAPDNPALAQQITIETPLVKGVISTLGASVYSWIIKPTKPYLHEEEQLIRSRYSERNLSTIMRGNRGLLRTDTQIFEVNKTEVRLSAGDQPDTLVFTLPLPDQAFYRETYVFYPDKYFVELFIESQGLEYLTGAANAIFTWGGGLAPTEEDSAQDMQYTQASYLMGNTRATFKSSGKKVDEEQAGGATRWVAQRNKYFLMALVPGTTAAGVKLNTWPAENYFGKYPPRLFETGLVFNLPTGEFNQQITLYLGPLSKQLITAVDPTLEKTMSWGWPIIKPFSVAVLWTLQYFHKFISNYGIVLLLFSILVKIVTWFFTYKSHKSTKRMQYVQPVIKAIQEKFKNDPQRMQKEVMGVYKEFKINPAGGCWPVLLQMPLLYALFIVFRSTIELRGQPFILWINDLSMPDVLFNLPFSIPLYGDHFCVLPWVMAISTFLQSRHTMTDPNQKAMLYFMPIMFILLFNNFPSGLTLYYTLFNLLTWLQQKIMKVEDPELEKKVHEAQKELEILEKRKEKKSKQ